MLHFVPPCPALPALPWQPPTRRALFPGHKCLTANRLSDVVSSGNITVPFKATQEFLVLGNDFLFKKLDGLPEPDKSLFNKTDDSGRRKLLQGIGVPICPPECGSGPFCVPAFVACRQQYPQVV